MDTLTDFVNSLFAKGIELALKKSGALYLWPKHSKSKLTDFERQFLVEYHNELVAFVRAGLQPKLPDDTLPAPPTEPTCIYCRKPCVGQAHPAYPVLHYFDPEVAAARNAKATKVMYVTAGTEPWR